MRRVKPEVDLILSYGWVGDTKIMSFLLGRGEKGKRWVVHLTLFGILWNIHICCSLSIKCVYETLFCIVKVLEFKWWAQKPINELSTRITLACSTQPQPCITLQCIENAFQTFFTPFVPQKPSWLRCTWRPRCFCIGEPLSSTQCFNFYKVFFTVLHLMYCRFHTIRWMHLQALGTSDKPLSMCVVWRFTAEIQSACCWPKLGACGRLLSSYHPTVNSKSPNYR